MNTKIWLSSPHLGGTEQKYVQEAFDTNWVAPLGPNVDGFEHDLQAFLGGDAHVAALSSGTAAMHLALIQLGIQPGDEVLCQSFTFSATVNPVVYLGAIPVFIDSEATTWNMCPDTLRLAIEDRIAAGKTPKAIIAVDLYGMPANLPAILSVAAAYNIPVIEDAAEALGSSIDGKMCGTYGEFAVLSFNGNKIITTSGGGALAAPDANRIKETRFLATQARDAAPHYQHSKIGYNYRLSNICAGIGRGQMEVLNTRIAQRRSVYQQYVDRYGNHHGFTFLPEPSGYFSNRWLTTLLIDNALTGFTREDLRLALEAQNIESRPLWKPMHLQPIFSHYPYYGGSLSTTLFEQGLCLPSGSNLTEHDMKRIFDVIDSLLGRL